MVTIGEENLSETTVVREIKNLIKRVVENKFRDLRYYIISTSFKTDDGFKTRFLRR